MAEKNNNFLKNAFGKEKRLMDSALDFNQGDRFDLVS